MNEYIGNFQISVDNIFLCQVIQSLKDVFDDGFSFIFIKISIFPESRLQITLITELCDDIAVPVASENFVTFKNIGVV
jgi:hypothetical protein